MMKQRMALTIVVVLLAALRLTHAFVVRLPPFYLRRSGTTYDFIFSSWRRSDWNSGGRMAGLTI